MIWIILLAGSLGFVAIGHYWVGGVASAIILVLAVLAKFK